MNFGGPFATMDYSLPFTQLHLKREEMYHAFGRTKKVFAWNLLSNKNLVKQFTVTKFTVDQIEKSKLSTGSFCPAEIQNAFKSFSGKNVSFKRAHRRCVKFYDALHVFYGASCGRQSRILIKRQLSVKTVIALFGAKNFKIFRRPPKRKSSKFLNSRFTSNFKGSAVRAQRLRSKSETQTEQIAFIKIMRDKK